MASSVEPSRALGRFPPRLVVVLLIVSLLGCDHVTKMAAEGALGHGQTVRVVGGLLELKYAANHDTAFGLLHDLGMPRSRDLLLAAAVLGLVGVIAAWIAAGKRASRVQHVGFALVLGGALGNVVDRAVRGYVVDFIHLARWPIFNVADVAIVIGTMLLFTTTTRAPSRFFARS